ncbi:nuclear transport factor 2 family protein [Sphingomonas sp. PR090111-T3T-6A]|uniref:nuclear transport factor 2 family protein n=1 Tax=Sphingomonas sp. PR090111-T3T-6A TaxID=685778 RepID=UPI000399EF34|nr:nuclear transport factor 2 family protein [Sphingomonas sp. PR090111-T3T-6A]
MNSTHVDAYFKALSARDKLGIVPHFSEAIVLHGPIYAEPIEGKDAVINILTGFIETIDSLEVGLTMSSGHDVAVFFTFSRDGITVKGNERLHVDDAGLIDAIEVAWRPLPAAVQIQEIFAARMGFPAMRLVSGEAAA